MHTRIWSASKDPFFRDIREAEKDAAGSLGSSSRPASHVAG